MIHYTLYLEDGQNCVEIWAQRHDANGWNYEFIDNEGIIARVPFDAVKSIEEEYVIE